MQRMYLEITNAEYLFQKSVARHVSKGSSAKYVLQNCINKFLKQLHSVLIYFFCPGKGYASILNLSIYFDEPSCFK